MLHFNTLTTSRVEGGHRVLKAALKASTGDLLTVVDGIEKILNRQYESYTHLLATAKMKIHMKLPRDLMRELINKVSPYALLKIYDQYLLVRLAKKYPKEHELKPCQRIFATTMGLPCAHMIVAALETEEKKLLLEDVHPHWRFKKPESSLLTPTRDFVSDPPPALPSNSSPVPSELASSSSSFSFSSDSDLLPDVDDLIRGRIESPPASEIEGDSEHSDLNDLLNIAEPSVAKAKGRPRGSTNKKGLMTRAEKVANSTKRDLSGFEHVEQELAARAKRTKKTAGQARKERGGRSRGGGIQEQEVEHLQRQKVEHPQGQRQKVEQLHQQPHNLPTQ